MTDDKTQLDKFKEMARQLERADDETKWDATVHKLAKTKPKPA